MAQKAVRLLERRFKVRASLDRAWSHLGRVEEWPTWARHIRKVVLEPPGSLTTDSKGSIVLTNGIRSTFRMEALDRGASWKWAGPFLWFTVHYDHQFRRTGAEETEIGFVLDGEGFVAGVFGRLFAAIYARNLDRAIPNLVSEIEHAP